MAGGIKIVSSINSELLNAPQSQLNVLVLRPTDPFNFNVQATARMQKLFFAALPQGPVMILAVQSAKEAASELQSWLQHAEHLESKLAVFIHPQWVSLDPEELYYRIIVSAQAVARRPEIRVHTEGTVMESSRWRYVGEAQLAYVSLTQQRGNQINPETFVSWTEQLFRNISGVTLRVLSAAECLKLGMTAFLAMGRAAAVAPRVLIVEYFSDVTAPRVALVGKGVTFDTGGLNLKPDDTINDMYLDKAGAAVAVCSVYGMALKKARVNVVAVAGLLENAVGPLSVRPDDIVSSMSGKTIEIVDTDAEGRVLLADTMWYTGVTYKPAIMIDIATLTGSMMETFNHYRSAVFGTHTDVVRDLMNAGEATGDRLWPMPLIDEIDVSGTFATVKNYKKKVSGGLYAARFLKEFVPPVVGAWVHIDFCGTCMDKDNIIEPFGPHLMMHYVEKVSMSK